MIVPCEDGGAIVEFRLTPAQFDKLTEVRNICREESWSKTMSDCVDIAINRYLELEKAAANR